MGARAIQSASINLTRARITHKIILVSVFLLNKKGKKACTSAIKLVKLTLISELNAARSTDPGLEKSYLP